MVEKNDSLCDSLFTDYKQTDQREDNLQESILDLIDLWHSEDMFSVLMNRNFHGCILSTL